MDVSLVNLLQSNKTYNPKYYSYVSLIHPKGKFQFDRVTREIFWENYAKSNDIKGIAEKPEHVLPILADIDLKEEVDDPNNIKKLYKKEDVIKIIKIYQEILENIIDDNNINTTCVLLEKKPYIDDKNDKLYLKNGFHLHFPFIFLSKVDQEIHLIPRIRNNLIKLGYDPKMVDKSYCRVPWLIYGSVKSEKQESYRITRIYNKNQEKISIKNAFSNYFE